MKRSISELKELLVNIPSITPWDCIELNKVYHIPPVGLLEKRDVIFLEKNNEEAKYKQINSTDNNVSKMHKTSAFAKFLIEEKKF